MGGHLRLWVVRHARPLIEQGRCYGALNVPADAVATAQSAQKLVAALPSHVRVFHSPLQRCEQLAHALQGLRPNWVSKPDARLLEMNFGDWEGRAWESVARTEIDAWVADFAAYRPGGGECLVDMLARVADALHDARYAGNHLGDGGDVVWVTHAGVARCVQWLEQSVSGALVCADQWPLGAPAWGDWVVFD